MRGEVRDSRAKFGRPRASLKTGFRLISIQTAAVRKLIPYSATIAADESNVDFASIPSTFHFRRRVLYNVTDGRIHVKTLFTSHLIGAHANGVSRETRKCGNYKSAYAIGLG